MNITGIIAEYNPFHNGHAYQLRRAKEETDADYTIIIMSGNFVQRGAPALLDKFTRAEMALSQGADLIIELPALWSSASAEYFAGAGVALLEQLGCVNSLCYGCETPDSDLSAAVCSLLSRETGEYKNLLSGFLKKGANYALAREKAVLTLLPSADKSAVMDILENPNNILALEYQKAAAASRSSMQMHPILRKGEGYHSTNLSGTLASASAVRRFLAECPADTGFCSLEPLTQAVPEVSCQLLLNYRHDYPFLFEDDCSQMLHFCLLKNASAGFSDYADCTLDFSNKICRHLDCFTSFSDFCARLKSKDMTYTRISRILLHILLDVKKNDYTFWRSRSYVPYARVLGFRKESRSLLAHLKKHSALPLLMRAADAEKILPKEAYAFFQKNLFADSIYRGLIAGKGGQPMPNEYRQRIVII